MAMLYEEEFHDGAYFVHKDVDAGLLLSNLPTQGLHLLDNHHIYHYMMIS